MTFDFGGAIAARDAGIKQVAENNTRFLEVARQTAKDLGKGSQAVTADMVRRDCPFEPLHPNAWGAVFKDPAFEWTGLYQRSVLVQGHGNLQRVWRLK